LPSRLFPYTTLFRSIPPHWTGDPTFLRSRFQQRVREAAEVPAPLWVGELGYDLGAPGATSYIDASLDEADDLGIGWAWWQWRERDRKSTRLNSSHVK